MNIRNILAVLALAGTVVACAPSNAAGQKAVFRSRPQGNTLTYRVHVQEPVDLIMYFYSLTSDPARLRRLSTASAMRNVTQVAGVVYNSRRVGYNLATGLGILSKECPREFVPRAPPAQSL